MRPLRNRFVRLAISVACIAAIIAVCVQFPQINDATVALLMVLCIFGIASQLGSAEALTAAIAAGIGFDYYFLGSPGFALAAPEHVVALAAFTVTAVATGQLAAQAKRRRIEAEQQRAEMEKLYLLVNALLDTGGADATMTELVEKVMEIFSASGAALYDGQSGRIIRTGPRAELISDEALREAARSGRRTGGAGTLSVTPIRHGGEVAGSIGLVGAPLSPPLVEAIAGRVGLGLARLYAIERTTEAEVVRRSEELKSAVLDALAHEIRNPLNSVKIAATTLLSDRIESESGKREMLTVIDEEADRMDRFIQEALQLARMEASELSLNKGPQSPVSLIRAAVEELGAASVQRTIEVNAPDSLAEAECDRGMILRVLKQLLNNALKYSPPDSPLTISAQSTGATIVISVADRGPGVSENERERIFERYYRGRAASSGVPGTGLGLASAKCIVQAHGGKIWVTSPPGGGAAFHVSLPAASAKRTVGAAR